MPDAHEHCRKRTKYAWRQMYVEIEKRAKLALMVDDHGNIPEHVKAEFMEMAVALKKEFTCAICRDEIQPDALTMTRCGHKFCTGCIDEWKKIKPECPTCRKKIA